MTKPWKPKICRVRIFVDEESNSCSFLVHFCEMVVCLPFMKQMLQLHSLSSRCGEWRTWKVTLPQWQLPLCMTSVLMVLCSVKP